MSGTSLCSAEDALRFGIVPQQVALVARQFVHDEIYCTTFKREIRLMRIQSPLKSSVMVQTDWPCTPEAECRLHRDRYAPRQHATIKPGEHDSQIDAAARSAKWRVVQSTWPRTTF